MKDNVTDNLTSQTMTEKNLDHNELRHFQKKTSINQNTNIVPNIVLILVRKENPS